MWSETVSVINLQSILKSAQKSVILLLKFENFLEENVAPSTGFNPLYPSIRPL